MYWLKKEHLYPFFLCKKNQNKLAFFSSKKKDINISVLALRDLIGLACDTIVRSRKSIGLKKSIYILFLTLQKQRTLCWKKQIYLIFYVEVFHFS